MNALTHPADERRIREIVRDEVGRDVIRVRVGNHSPTAPRSASPLVECGAPTVGETAAPDDVLRAPSGAAIPYDGTVVEFIANEHSAVRVARDTRGGICLSAYGVSDPRLSSDEMFAQLNHCELMQFTKLLANILGCDLVPPL